LDGKRGKETKYIKGKCWNWGARREKKGQKFKTEKSVKGPNP
jgi:hypothetical protein